MLVMLWEEGGFLYSYFKILYGILGRLKSKENFYVYKMYYLTIKRCKFKFVLQNFFTMSGSDNTYWGFNGACRVFPVYQFGLRPVWWSARGRPAAEQVLRLQLQYGRVFQKAGPRDLSVCGNSDHIVLLCKSCTITAGRPTLQQLMVHCWPAAGARNSAVDIPDVLVHRCSWCSRFPEIRVPGDLRALPIIGISEGILGMEKGKLTDIPHEYRNQAKRKATTQFYILKLSTKTFYWQRGGN